MEDKEEKRNKIGSLKMDINESPCGVVSLQNNLLDDNNDN